jgi:opacity protein-like surface antigen
MRRTILAAATLALLATPAAAQERNDEKDFTWKGTIPAGKWITIQDMNGDVDVVASTGTEVEVTAHKHWRRGDPEDVRIEVVKGGAGGDVMICALWFDARCDENGIHNDRHWGDRRNDVAVDFTVKLPKGVRAHMATVNGSLHIDGAGAEVEASTVNGGIRVTTASGPVNATTVNGGIDVDMHTLSGDDDMRFETVNGSISVDVPAALDAELEMSTVNGGFDSDFPLSLSGRINPHHIRATIGKGGRRLVMRTVNGGITLRKQG